MHVFFDFVVIDLTLFYYVFYFFHLISIFANKLLFQVKKIEVMRCLTLLILDKFSNFKVLLLMNNVLLELSYGKILSCCFHFSPKKHFF